MNSTLKNASPQTELQDAIANAVQALDDLHFAASNANDDATMLQALAALGMLQPNSYGNRSHVADHIRQQAALITIARQDEARSNR